MKFVLSFLIIPLSYAMETQYKWILEDSNLVSGKCFEVDVKTKGANYLKQVNPNLCKPKATSYVFHLKEGRCFEIDDATEGNNYFVNTKIELCKPKNTIHVLGEFNKKNGCYDVDKATQGQMFFQIKKAENCESENNLYTWEYKSPGQGQCFVLNSKSPELKIKVKESECKPNKPLYRFIKETPIKGACLEEHTENPRLYSLKVDISKCRPEKTLFVFYRQSNSLAGQCYEIDEETKGEKYVNQVRTENCKDR